MPRTHAQPALQDYLKAIYQVTESRGGEPAKTKAIAARLGVSQPSVSAMLDRLATDGQVDYVHYAGASLTLKGRSAALAVVRRHRLLELYLHRFLNLGWDEVHDQAEILEHALTARVEAAIDDALGHPAFDPHGDPIPAADGSMPPPAWHSLWDTDSEGSVRVARVSDADPALLRHLQEMGIVPGAVVSRIRRDAGGIVRLRAGRREQLLGREAAEQVYVTPV